MANVTGSPKQAFDGTDCTVRSVSHVDRGFTEQSVWKTGACNAILCLPVSLWHGSDMSRLLRLGGHGLLSVISAYDDGLTGHLGQFGVDSSSMRMKRLSIFFRIFFWDRTSFYFFNLGYSVDDPRPYDNGAMGENLIASWLRLIPPTKCKASNPFI